MNFMLDLDYEWEKVGDQGCFGTTLFEVFNVSIDKGIQVYGTFRVEDEKGTLYFYNRPPSMECESVKPNPNPCVLSLMQSPRLIPAGGTITFSIDLKDKYGNEFVKGSFTLDLMDEGNRHVFDRYLKAPINANLGSATVYYTLPLVALTSDIQIKLINSSGLSNVKGRIVARYGDNYDESAANEVKQHSCFLLYETTSKDKAVQLKDKDLLPLSRSSVVVPARRLLLIEMDLEFHHSNGRSEHLQVSKIEALACTYNALYQEIQLQYATLYLVVTFSSEAPYR